VSQGHPGRSSCCAWPYDGQAPRGPLSTAGRCGGSIGRSSRRRQGHHKRNNPATPLVGCRWNRVGLVLYCSVVLLVPRPWHLGFKAANSPWTPEPSPFGSSVAFDSPGRGEKSRNPHSLPTALATPKKSTPRRKADLVAENGCPPARPHG